MGKNQHRVSRFFPSPFGSCRYGTSFDVIESSIIPINPQSVLPIQRIDSSILPHPSIKSKSKTSATSKNGEIDGGLKGRTLSSLSNPHSKSFSARFTKISSSSNGGWFSSEEGEKEKEVEFDAESDEFFSLSSHSSGSFRRKISSASRRTRRHTVSDMGSCRFDLSDISADGSSTCRETGKVEANSRREIGSFGRETPKARRRRSVSRESEMGSCPFEESAILADSSSIGKMKSKSRRKTGETSRETGRETGKSSRGIGKETESEAGEGLEIPSTSTGKFSVDTGSTSCREMPKSRRRSGGDQSSQIMGRCPIVMGGGRVEESYAVEKISRDPYSDFMESMVEMIVETEISGDEDLEKLLQCFLSLNSSRHHRVILEVFAEISEAFCPLTE